MKILTKSLTKFSANSRSVISVPKEKISHGIIFANTVPLSISNSDEVTHEEFFSYHGWELLGGKMVYLSDSRADCKCGVIIPKISSERMTVAWRNDLQILGIDKKVYNLNGTHDNIVSLKVSLPFWLYLHLIFTCKLFMNAGLKVQFLLLLIGKTGSLKTTICETFAEPFNEGSMLRFESTSHALELYREECIDQTMVVDDIFKKKASKALINEWVLQSRSINIQQYNENFILWHRIIVDLMLRNQTAATVAEPWQQFLIIMQQAIATSTILIAVSKEEFEQNGGRYTGFQKTDKVISTVRYLLTDSGRELDSDSTTIFKELLNHGVSKGYEKKDGNGGTRKRYLKRVKLNGHLVEMFVLSKDAMEKAIEKFLEEELRQCFTARINGTTCVIWREFLSIGSLSATATKKIR